MTMKTASNYGNDAVDKTIKYFEGYYGSEYNPVMRDAVREFLIQYPPDTYKPLIREVRRTFSHSLRCAPGIKELEDAVKNLGGENKVKTRNAIETFEKQKSRTLFDLTREDYFEMAKLQMTEQEYRDYLDKSDVKVEQQYDDDQGFPVF